MFSVGVFGEDIDSDLGSTSAEFSFECSEIFAILIWSIGDGVLSLPIPSLASSTLWVAWKVSSYDNKIFAMN